MAQPVAFKAQEREQKMKRMRLISSIFEKKKNLPKEEEQTEKEDPCTSYSHLEGNKELSRRETPSLGGNEKKRKVHALHILKKKASMGDAWIIRF